MKDQHFSITLHDDGYEPFRINREVIAPKVILRIGRLQIFMDPERLAELHAVLEGEVFSK